MDPSVIAGRCRPSFAAYSDKISSGKLIDADRGAPDSVRGVHAIIRKAMAVVPGPSSVVYRAEANGFFRTVSILTSGRRSATDQLTSAGEEWGLQGWLQGPTEWPVGATPAGGDRVALGNHLICRYA